MKPELSDRAIDCFTHGVAHLLHELGTEAGLIKGMEVLDALAKEDLRALLAASDSDQSSTIPNFESDALPERPLRVSAADGSR
jgi:hypothetical protein